VKDRAALSMINAAVSCGALKPGGLVVEGTGGNTGVGLAMLCASLGYRCYFTMPSNVSIEKQLTMKAYGASVELCDTKYGVKDDGHYTSRARKVARENGGIHTDQFYNLANADAHKSTTGPEIKLQLEDLGISSYAFATGAGTGGTIAGIAEILSSPSTSIVLADFEGSGLRSYLSTGEFVKSPGSTEAEGVGISRLTRNFNVGTEFIDGCVSVSDVEISKMCRYLAEKEGIWVGPSAAGNVVGAVKAGLHYASLSTNDEPVTVVTVLCDGGASYLSKVRRSKERRTTGAKDGWSEATAKATYGLLAKLTTFHSSLRSSRRCTTRVGGRKRVWMIAGFWRRAI